jgi:hypothetical protein
MNNQYSQTGNYTAIAGVVVLILSKFGVTTDQSTILLVIGGIVAVTGIVNQFIAHKNLAITAGAYPQK